MEKFQRIERHSVVCDSDLAKRDLKGKGLLQCLFYLPAAQRVSKELFHYVESHVCKGTPAKREDLFHLYLWNIFRHEESSVGSEPHECSLFQAV